MAVKKFFKRVGRNLQQTSGEFTKQAGRAAGGILGAAAGKALLSGIATYGPEVAETAPLLALSTGGFIPGPRHKPRLAILHGQESVIPAGVKVTKYQKKVIQSNKRKQKAGTFVYG
jgi:hypothetical protein